MTGRLKPHNWKQILCSTHPTSQAVSFQDVFVTVCSNPGRRCGSWEAVQQGDGAAAGHGGEVQPVNLDFNRLPQEVPRARNYQVAVGSLVSTQLLLPSKLHDYQCQTILY